MLAGAMLIAIGVPPTAHAEMSAQELAKISQNPVGDLVSVPFQNNTNFDAEPRKAETNIQPVIPINVKQPVEHHHAHHHSAGDYSRGLRPGQDSTTGLGDIQFAAFLSPPSRRV